MGLEESVSVMGFVPNEEGTDMTDAEISFQKDMDGEMVGIFVGVNHVARLGMEEFKDVCKRALEIW